MRNCNANKPVGTWETARKGASRIARVLTAVPMGAAEVAECARWAAVASRASAGNASRIVPAKNAARMDAAAPAGRARKSPKYAASMENVELLGARVGQWEDATAASVRPVSAS